jgi:spore germination protein KB
MFTEKITTRQLFYLLFIPRTTIIISFLPSLTSADALQDAWLSALLAFLPGMAIIVLIGKLALKFPEKDIVGYSKEMLGNLPGKLLLLFYFFYFLHVASTDLRLYTGVIKTGFLAKAPLVVVAGVMMLAVVAVVYAGLEPLGRCADVIFPIFLLMLIAGLLFPLARADFQNLQPVLARGWSPVIMGSIIPIMITGWYLHMIIIVPSVVEPQKTLRAALWSFVLSTVFLALYSILVVSVLGADGGSRSAFPVLKMLRSVRFSRFWERVEAVNIFGWGLGIFITLALGLYFSAWIFSRLLGLKDYRPLLFPLAVIIVTLSIQQYASAFEVWRFFTPGVGAPVIFFVILFPIAVLWAAYLLRRPGKGKPPPRGQ